MHRFDGKVVIVTGGGSGIGTAIARRFAAEHASVVVSDLHIQTAKTVADSLAADGAKAIAIAADVADEAAVGHLVDETVAQFGALDVLVNNAGIGEQPKPIEERTAAEWLRVINTNLSSVFFGIKHAARIMKPQGRGGVIINISSILGSVAFNGAPSYTAAKHGINGLTKAAAIELAPDGIRVVAVAPAFIHTPMIAGFEEAVLPLHPIGRLGDPRDVAGMVAYLASDEASFLTGASYLVDGGYTAQ